MASLVSWGSGDKEEVERKGKKKSLLLYVSLLNWPPVPHSFIQLLAPHISASLTGISGSCPAWWSQLHV